MKAGWWAKLEGDERDLRELAAHFSTPSLKVIEEEGSFSDPETVKQRGRALLALASGALHLEFGRFAPPRVSAAVLVDDTGGKQHCVRVSSSVRMHAEINARVERARPDGTVGVVELVAPPVETTEWADIARRDPDVEDILAILGREDVRWHDLYHVYERILLAGEAATLHARGGTSTCAIPIRPKRIAAGPG
jgi:hypothetical protein